MSSSPRIPAHAARVLPPRDGGYLLVGADGSPYSVKMRGYFRFRRIPFKWVAHMLLQQPGQQGDSDSNGMQDDFFPELKAKVIPIVVRPDDTYANDSTPLILELEATFPQRKTIPSDPALAFLCAYLEDFSDEWMTKPMFEYRFHTPVDAKFGAEWQSRQSPVLCKQGEYLKQMTEFFAERQRNRRSLVGCTDMEVMELSLRTCCQIIEHNLDQGYNFLFGHRPSAADFALMGHLRQMALDPRPSRIMHEYPGAWAWVFRMDDLSGLELLNHEFIITDAVKALVSFANKTYAPFLLANVRAIQQQQKILHASILDGTKTHTQPPFRYQAKCLQKLQQQYLQLDAASAQKVKAFIPPTELGLDTQLRAKL